MIVKEYQFDFIVYNHDNDFNEEELLEMFIEFCESKNLSTTGEVREIKDE